MTAASMSPPKAAMARKSGSRSRVVLRLTLLGLWLLLLNLWVLIQFGLELRSIFVVEAALGIVGFLMKPLTKTHLEQVHSALQKLFYAFLRTPVLIVLYIALAALTLSASAVVVTGDGADRACIRHGTAPCGRALVSGEKKSIFFARVGAISAQLHDSEPLPLSHRPWIPSQVSTSAFAFPPAVLIRVGYGIHFALDGGRIEVRNVKTKELIASADTTAASASLLLGRSVPIPHETIDGWNADLAGVKAVPAQNARDRWANFIRPATDVKLARNEQLEAVFRTRAQIAAQSTEVAARQTFTVDSRTSLQDVVMKRLVP